MRIILVDSNIILDLILDDPKWAEWSKSAMKKQARHATLCINPIIYAEISIGFNHIEELEKTITKGSFKILEIPKKALFLAGKAFLEYRKRGGTKLSPLPDFFIGAQAAVMKIDLITRDISRYQSYFPTVKIISP